MTDVTRAPITPVRARAPACGRPPAPAPARTGIFGNPVTCVIRIAPAALQGRRRPRPTDGVSAPGRGRGIKSPRRQPLATAAIPTRRLFMAAEVFDFASFSDF